MAQTKKFDVVIIGGGASGLMCASRIKKKSTLILEKADRVGKKILATGNGRCNLTNINIDTIRYNTSKVEPYFKKYGVSETLDYFSKLGLMTYSDEEGRVYPVSDTASSVLDVLRLKIDSMKNVNIMCGVDVKKIDKKNETYILHMDDETIECKSLVISTGSVKGEKYLKDLDVKYTPYKRSLGALCSDTNSGLHGVRVDNVKVTLELDNKNYSQNGEILFKDNAISGIVIFNLSAFIARFNVVNAYLHINFLNSATFSEVKNVLTIRKNTLSDRCVRDYFTGMLHKALSINILSRTNIDTNKNVASLTEKEIEELAHLLTDYKIRVSRVADNNQVFAGGVELDSLDSSLKVKDKDNLYLTGELINVDGECGGYNLQWAWTSAMIVADSINDN